MYKNKKTGKTLEPKTFAELYICQNNSNYELIADNKKAKSSKDPVDEKDADKKAKSKEDKKDPVDEKDADKKESSEE